MTDTAIALSSTNVRGALAESGLYSTVTGDDMASRLKVYNAVNSAEQISDEIEKAGGPITVTVADIVVQEVEVTNQTTGAIESAPRVILIDDKGKAHAATSKGMLTAVKNIVGILGIPATWGQAVKFKVSEKRGRNGYRFLTMDIA